MDPKGGGLSWQCINEETIKLLDYLDFITHHPFTQRTLSATRLVCFSTCHNHLVRIVSTHGLVPYTSTLAITDYGKRSNDFRDPTTNFDIPNFHFRFQERILCM